MHAGSAAAGYQSNCERSAIRMRRYHAHPSNKVGSKNFNENEIELQVSDCLCGDRLRADQVSDRVKEEL